MSDSEAPKTCLSERRRWLDRLLHWSIRTHLFDSGSFLSECLMEETGGAADLLASLHTDLNKMPWHSTATGHQITDPFIVAGW